ncbi:hypothetical protein BaRGS_00035574, partial [Batillaria attramentaria]
MHSPEWIDERANPNTCACIGTGKVAGNCMGVPRNESLMDRLGEVVESLTSTDSACSGPQVGNQTSQGRVTIQSR